MKNNLYIIIFLSVLFGCKKSSDVTKSTVTPDNVACNTNGSYQIVFNGSTWPHVHIKQGDIINFQAHIEIQGKYGGYYIYQPDALEGCTILWNFGDGNTQNALSPNHVYDSSGTYTVQMILNNDSANIRSSKIYIGPAPIYTHLIAGTRQWRRTRIITDGPTHISVTTIIDTTFAIDMLNNEAISVGSRSLDYMPGFSTPNTFVYWSSGGNPMCSLSFDHITNKIQLVIDYGWWMTDTFENI